MISPFTRRGTEVVCVDDDPHRFMVPDFLFILDLDGLSKGTVYTVDRIEKSVPWSSSDYLVVLREIVRRGDMQGFSIERFRLLDLAGLDALLTQSIINPLEHEHVR